MSKTYTADNISREIELYKKQNNGKPPLGISGLITSGGELDNGKREWGDVTLAFRRENVIMDDSPDVEYEKLKTHYAPNLFYSFMIIKNLAKPEDFNILTYKNVAHTIHAEMKERNKFIGEFSGPIQHGDLADGKRVGSQVCQTFRGNYVAYVPEGTKLNIFYKELGYERTHIRVSKPSLMAAFNSVAWHLLQRKNVKLITHNSHIEHGALAEKHNWDILENFGIRELNNISIEKFAHFIQERICQGDYIPVKDSNGNETYGYYNEGNYKCPTKEEMDELRSAFFKQQPQTDPSKKPIENKEYSDDYKEQLQKYWDTVNSTPPSIAFRRFGKGSQWVQSNSPS